MSAQNSTKDSNHTAVDNSVCSDLYVSCFEGDIDSVRRILEKSTFANINRREPNGSTALHIAVECEHVDIARLLLHEYGVVRHLTDQNDHTAFELAETEEIRRLFYRPTSDENRFCGNEKLGVAFSSKQKDDEQAPSRRVQQHDKVDEIQQRAYEDALSGLPSFKNGPLYRLIFGKPIKQTKQEQLNGLLSVIDERIGPSNKQYAKARELVQKYSETGRLDQLIRLFTMETPFYRFINERQEGSMSFFSLFEKSEESFRDRAFEGICYRGLSMTEEDLEMYEWALQAENRYLEVETFCSSTLDEQRARFLAEANRSDQRRSVLMVFEFLTVCSSAIRLSKLSNKLPCLSDFEDEDEILILPGTVFSVQKIDRTQPLPSIYLTHLNLDKETSRYTNKLLDYVLSD